MNERNIGDYQDKLSWQNKKEEWSGNEVGFLGGGERRGSGIRFPKPETLNRRSAALRVIAMKSSDAAGTLMRCQSQELQWNLGISVYL